MIKVLLSITIALSVSLGAHKINPEGNINYRGSDSIQSTLDGLVKELAIQKKCRVLIKATKSGGSSYYSGFDGRTNTLVTDFSGSIDIGSCTKVFTATSIIQLVEKGKLSLQSRLVDLLPNDTLYNGLSVIDGRNYIDSVTVYHLLTHTSGFPDYFVAGDDAKEISIHGDSTLRFKPEELVSMAKRINKPTNKPGAQYHYSNTNYILLGRIIEKLSGLTYQQYVQKHILDPLSLKSTYFASSNPPRERSEGHYKGKLSVMPATLAWSAGDIISTLDDMHIFINAWNAGRLFNDPSTLVALKKDLDMKQPGTIKYGLGIMDIMGKCIGHAGQTFGFQSFMGVTYTNSTIAIGIDDASVSFFEPLVPLLFLL